MKKTQKKKFRQLPVTMLQADGDIHFAHGVVTDRRLAEAAVEQDASRDRIWLAEHPDAPYRLRPASALERAAHDLPVGSEVAVMRGSYGVQYRVMLGPKNSG